MVLSKITVVAVLFTTGRKSVTLCGYFIRNTGVAKGIELTSSAAALLGRRPFANAHPATNDEDVLTRNCLRFKSISF